MSTELSTREREILNAVYDGRSPAEIAEAAGIAESTVQWHIANTRRKLRAASSAEAVVKAYQRDLLDEPPHPSSLRPLRAERWQRRRRSARAIADATMRWMIAAVLVLVALIGIAGAATSVPLFRVVPPTLPTFAPSATTNPRP